MFSDDDRRTVRHEALRVYVRRHPGLAHLVLFGRAYVVGGMWAAVVVCAFLAWGMLPDMAHQFVSDHPRSVAGCTWAVAFTVAAALVWFHVGGLAGRLRAQGRGTRRITRYAVAAVVLLAVAGWVMWS